MWMIEVLALSSTTTRSDDDIVLDTGATHHIFHDESLFTTMSPYQKSVRTASANIESVSGIGSVEFRIFDLQDPTRSKTIKIEDVWYLPNCTKNLVSGSQLVSRGLHIKSSSHGLGVYTAQGIIAATARPKDGLFCFNTASNASVTSQNLPKVFLSDDVKKTVTELIHNRFAHAGLAALRKIDTVIGWKITRDRSTRSLNISQAHYIDDKIKSFGLGDAKSYSAPLDGYSGILPARLDESLADDTAYASAVGSLGYASNSTRPDISFAVSQLAGFNSSPVQRHWNIVCRVFRYLKGTNDYCIK
ncbi:hypothetical protein K3495_g8989 [Podosphaera aphanis]|nr:hypothetical protein K3495_g8989 [Podosphaera aphanis]